MENRKDDQGFTLVELLIVIVILGILSTVTVFAVRGITERGQTAACTADARTQATAYESYVAQYGGTSIATAAYNAIGTAPNQIAAGAAVALPAGATFAVGATPATTLKNAGFLRSVSSLVFIEAGGTVRSQDAKCGTVGTVLNQS